MRHKAIPEEPHEPVSVPNEFESDVDEGGSGIDTEDGDVVDDDGAETSEDVIARIDWPDLMRRMRFCANTFLGYGDWAIVDDILQDTYLAVIVAIHRGQIRKLNSLASYAGTILRRKVSAYIRCRAQQRTDLRVSTGEAEWDAMELRDQRPSPDQILLDTEREPIHKRALATLPVKHREILARFYVTNESPDRIMREMDLTETQYRLLKWRAKARATKNVRRIEARRLKQ